MRLGVLGYNSITTMGHHRRLPGHPTVDGRNPAGPHKYYSTIIPTASVDRFSIGSFQPPLTPQLNSHCLGTLPQINMEAHRGPYMEESSLIVGSSPLPC